MHELSKLTNSFNITLKRVKDFRSARRKLLSSVTMPSNERALLQKVSLEVHPNDGMYGGNAVHYLGVGLSAIHSIELALEKSNGDKPILKILDFPCGYGRVLRFLKSRFPSAEISASEIDPEMLRFCKRTFSVRTVPSETDFGRIPLNDKFDLIWCGSLVTHIDEKATSELLRFFYNHLSPNGLCVFTTHGQFSVDSIQNEKLTYGLTPDQQNKVVAEFHEHGYGYSDYEYQHGYGISAVSHERMAHIADTVGEWKELLFMERGWDNHQDVYGFARSTV